MGWRWTEMARARTTVIPRRDPSALVTAGFSAWSRNPIYLADALILTGAILWLDAVLALPLLFSFVWLIQTRFIRDEEARLTRSLRAGVRSLGRAHAALDRAEMTPRWAKKVGFEILLRNASATGQIVTLGRQDRGTRVKIGALTEVFPGENRVAMTPDSAVQLAKLGHSSVIQSGAGAKAGFSDAAYAAAGVEVLPDAAAVIAAADVVVKVRGPDAAELATFGRRADADLASSGRRRTPSCWKRRRRRT
jgi:hypothetical protein